MGMIYDIIDISARAYCRRDRAREPKQRDRPPGTALRPAIFIAFDTEAATDRTRQMPGFDTQRWDWRTQNLLFGAARIGTTAGMTAFAEILFYPDDLPEYALAILRDYVAAHTITGSSRISRHGGYVVALPERERCPVPELRWRDEPNVTVHLMPLSEFLREFHRIAYKKRGLVIGFNLPFDLSRLAFHWSAARSKRDAGALSLSLWSYFDEKTGRHERSRFHPNIIVKKAGPRRNFIRFARCKGGDDGVSKSWRGEFLDLGTLAFSLTAGTYSLAGAFKKFCDRELDKDVEHGIINPDYITYSRNDVKATVDLAKALLTLFDRFPVSRGAGGTLSETACYSPASIAKAFLAAAGFKAPAIPEEKKGPCCAAFYGGWTEVGLRGSIPVVLLDYRKMYQTQFVLQRIQDLLSSERLEFRDTTEEVAAFVEGVKLRDLFDPAIWPRLNAICWVVPAGEILTTKGRFDGKVFSTGMVPRDTGGKPVPYYLADIVLAKLLCGKAPRIVRAERIEGRGKCPLRKVALPGGAMFDPEQHDFFKLNVEEGARIKKGIGPYAALSPDVRNALVAGVKCIGNSGSYGIFAETNAQDLPGEEREWVDLVGDGDPLRVKVLHPEDPGRFNCPPLAGLITSGARLMLGLAHALVAERGGKVAFGDTDSLAVIATRDGREITVETTIADGYQRDRIPLKTLSWRDVEEIAAEFTALNPYDKDLIGSSLLEIKEPCGSKDGTKVVAAVTALCISSKRYCLKDEFGALVDYKESMLGMLLSPLDKAPGDDRRDPSSDWFRQAWYVIEANFCDHNSGHRDWLKHPRVRRLSVSSPAVMRNLETFNRGRSRGEQIRPFNFFITGTIIVREGGRATLHAVVAPFERDPENWARLNWVSTRSGERNHPAAPFVTVEQFLARYAEHISAEWLDHDGRPCNETTVGVLRRRPIRDGDHYLSTKESLTWGDDPQHAFDRDKGRDFKAGEAGAWNDVFRPALAIIGRRALADRLRTSPDTVKDWITGRRRPDDPARVQEVAAGLAETLGLFTEDEIFALDKTAILSAVPMRLALAWFFNVFATATIVASKSGVRKAASPALDKSAISRWGSFDKAPHALGDINRWVVALAIHSRGELRKIRRRVSAVKGPLGDRVTVFAYLSHLCGGPIVAPKPEEIFDATAELAAAIAIVALLVAVFREVATILNAYLADSRRVG